jgi:hypothetical protein
MNKKFYSKNLKGNEHLGDLVVDVECGINGVLKLYSLMIYCKFYSCSSRQSNNGLLRKR